MDQHPVEVIGPERAARARFLPARIKHQMVDDQLLSSGKQLAQGLLAVGPFENIVLVDAHPGQLAALMAQLVTQPRELFLPGEQHLALFDPLLSGNDSMVFHVSPSNAQSVRLDGRSRRRRRLGARCGLVKASAAASMSNCSCQYLL